LNKVSLICGSLIENIGGHNPFEALQLGSAVLSGKYVKNFQETYQDLENDKNCIIVKNNQELLFYLIRIMKDKDYLLSLTKKVPNFKTNNQQIIKEILNLKN
jgi:3-deoxy-D-manno-octulosonic-acid transferase